MNEYLEACCHRDLERKAPQSEKTRGELFEEEKQALLPLLHGGQQRCFLPELGRAMVDIPARRNDPVREVQTDYPLDAIDPPLDGEVTT